MARRISAVLAVAWSGWAAGASACEGGGVAAFLPCPPPLRRAWTARRPLASPLRADADGTHYEAIGVSQRASEGEIRSAYLKLAKRLHPDVSTDPADVARFQRIAEAYQVLSDGKLRAVYDQDLKFKSMGRRGRPSFPRRKKRGEAEENAPASPLVIAGTGILMLSIFKSIFGLIA